MDCNKKRKRKITEAVFPVIGTAFGLTFMIFIYAPFELYLTNLDDFWFTGTQMTAYTATEFIVAFAACAAVILIAAKLGDKVLTACSAILFFLLIAAYIQGNFLVSGLPGMDGSEIDWDAYPAERLKSAAVWILSACAVGILVWKLGGRRFRLAAGFTGAGIGAMLLISFVILSAASAGEKSETLVATDINIFNFSQEENLIVLHLDAVDACEFEKVMEKNPEYKEMLSDFTYFDNVMSGYPYTKCAVPLVLTGKWYEAERKFDDYLNDAFTESPLFLALRDHDYRIGIYDSNTVFLAKDRCDGLIDNFRTDASVPISAIEMAKGTIRMAMVKYAPWDLKDRGYVIQVRMQVNRGFKDGTDYSFHDSSNLKFYESLKTDEFCIDGVKSFKYIVLEGAHVPYQYDRELNIIENGTYDDNIEGTMTLCGAFLDKLEEAGIYDNSAIVLMADHGFNENNADSNLRNDTNLRQHPVLFIKGIGEKHEYTVSNAPVSHEDMADALIALSDGKSSEECFDWHENDYRERRFMNYDWLDVTYFEEYIQTGQAEDMSTFKPSGKIYGN